MSFNSYDSKTFTTGDSYPLEFGDYLENDESTVEDDFTESWKCTLNFTGSNPVYPVEMFISLMEQKYKIQFNSKDGSSEADSNLGSIILNHICDDELTPAGLWKKQFLSDSLSTSSQKTSTWSGIKKDLISHFGQPNIHNNKHGIKGGGYSMQERILMFYSLMRNPEEDLGIFRVRVSLVASILENGRINKHANQDWVRLLFLLGLSEEDRSLIVDEANFIYDINGLCSLLLERKKDLSGTDETNDTKQSVNSQEICDNNDENVISKRVPGQESLLNVQEASVQETNVNERLQVPEPEKTEKNVNEKDVKQEAVNVPDSRLVVEFENDDIIPENVKRIKKRKKGAKVSNKVPKQDSPSPRKSLGGRSECIICNKEFDSVAEYKKHNLEAHPADKPTKCPHCDFERLDRRNVQIHIQRSHGNQSNPEEKCICPQCNKSFTFRFNLNKHIRLSHGQGEKYKCHLCPHRCDYKTRLQEHINAIHTGVKNFKCDKCTFATSWRSQLIRHLWQVHNEGKGSVYTCEQCGYTTKRKELYRNHLMNVHNIGDFKPGLCTLCGMTFKTKNYLMDHMYKVHKKTLRGKDTKAAMKEKALKMNAPNNFEEDEYSSGNVI